MYDEDDKDMICDFSFGLTGKLYKYVCCIVNDMITVNLKCVSRCANMNFLLMEACTNRTI